VVGDEKVVGKSVGHDVEDGKVTLPVLWTYAGADDATRARIRDAYTLPGVEGRAARLREVCDLGPGVAYAERRAGELVEQAKARLRGLPSSAARDALEDVSAFVLERRW